MNTDNFKITKTELVWPGKRTKVEPVELPFQTIETINLPRGRRQEDLFSQPQQKLIKGDEKQPDLGQVSKTGLEWKDRLIWGDNFLVMGSLLKEFAGKINLIYIDPPFATGQDFSYQVKIGDTEWTKEPSAIEELAYRDTWGKGLESYLQMMYDRLVLMKELLADNGSIYVHLDYRVVHYIKNILDEIFGKDNLVNEIIWHYSRWTAEAKMFQKMHDSILWYSKSDKFTYNLQMQKYKSPEWIEDTVREMVNGKLVRVKDETGAYVKRDKKNIGVPMHDVWEDINFIAPTAKERTGYSTQKPPKLLERIIKASSSDNELIGDFFCGSGTTGIVAERLNRRWIMCDLGRYAIHTARKELLDIPNCKPFVVQNLGKYERHRWMKMNGDFYKYINFILELYKAEPIEGYQNLHGKKGNVFVRIGSVDAPVTLAEIQDALEECRKNKIKSLDVLGWEWEMGLHDMVKDEAERFGVKLKTLQIPREVMQVDQNTKQEVKFYELAYLKVGTKIDDKRVTINLEDFILENPELIPQEVRSKIENWSDFIDYWAVDWLFNQHPEKTEEDDTFHNMNQEYRTRKNPKLNLSMSYDYPKSGKYKILVKVIDIFGNDTTKLVEVKV